MQMALCSFLSLTDPSPWPQAVIKAVISSYSLKECAGPLEGGRKGGMDSYRLKEVEWRIESTVAYAIFS